jgi:ABC-type branched-subunit amino acid transport system ATPase component
MTAALEVKGITKSYGAIQVARDITIALQEGERHALIGPNGAGKTTLVNILSGTVTPNSGTISLFGHDITKDSSAKRTRKGLVRTSTFGPGRGKGGDLSNGPKRS